jgi:hypothetical protein
MKDLLEIITTLLAFGMGAMLFRRLGRVSRIILMQVVLCLVMEVIAVSLKENNWVYNLFMPVETALLLVAAAYCFREKERRWVLLLYPVFAAVFAIDMVYFPGFWKIATHAAVVQGFVLGLVYTIIIYRRLTDRGETIADKPVVISGIGMLLYFACIVPFLCVMGYLFDKDPELCDRIFVFVIIPMSLLRYLFIAIAFFVEGRKTPASLPDRHF